MATKIPVTEVCIIYLKEAYALKDPSTPAGKIWATSIETLKACKGFRDIYTSTVVEDPKQARMFINWDCVEDHFSFYDQPHFPAFREQLVSICTLPPYPIHVVFLPAQPRALLSPTTAIYMAYFPVLTTPEQKKTWEDGWKKFLARTWGEAGRLGALDEHQGWVNEEMDLEYATDGGDGASGREKKKAWMATLGWRDVESHKRFREGEIFKSAWETLEGFDKMEMYHVEF